MIKKDEIFLKHWKELHRERQEEILSQLKVEVKKHPIGRDSERGKLLIKEMKDYLSQREGEEAVSDLLNDIFSIPVEKKEKKKRYTRRNKLEDRAEEIGWTLEGESGDYELFSNEHRPGVTIGADTLDEVEAELDIIESEQED